MTKRQCDKAVKIALYYTCDTFMCCGGTPDDYGISEKEIEQMHEAFTRKGEMLLNEGNMRLCDIPGTGSMKDILAYVKEKY